jgi:aspartyl-tRNA(Asn)/glutamyl-tRNA(Gln) amidotransferase subunit C
MEIVTGEGGNLMSTEHHKAAKGIDVGYVANLARLHLSDEEQALLQGQLEHIVGYVQQIDALDVSGVDPTSHAVAITNVMRADQVKESLPHDVVMANAPAEVDGQFQVPRIVE